MALNRSEKESIVADLHEKFSRSGAVIITKFYGVDVSGANELRKKLRESGAEFKVSKNTLFKRAIEDTSAEILDQYLTGSNAVAIGYESPVALAKVLVDFAKENELFEIRCGLLNGRPIDAAQIKALAELPSREVLLAQFLAVLAGVSTCLVRTLSGIPRKLLYTLRAIEEQKK